MNQMKHSPGPWHIEVDPTYLSIAVVKDVTGKEIEGMFSVNRESEMATARLIAAAPELLNQLIACVGCMKDYVRRQNEYGHPGPLVTNFDYIDSLISKITQGDQA